MNGWLFIHIMCALESWRIHRITQAVIRGRRACERAAVLPTGCEDL